MVRAEIGISHLFGHCVGLTHMIQGEGPDQGQEVGQSSHVVMHELLVTQIKCELSCMI